MRWLAAAVFIVVSAVAGAIGGLWAWGKATGSEFDLCSGGECKSGWYGAGFFLVIAVIAGAAGIDLLRRHRNREG